MLGAATSTTVVTYVKTPCDDVFLETTYSVTIVGGIGTTNWLATPTTTGSVLTIDISSSSPADAGTYILTLTTQTQQGSFSYSDVYVLNVVVVDPCYTTTWNANSIADIIVSVLQSPVSVTTFTASSVPNNICGTVTYTLSPTTISFITMDASTR